MSGGSDLVALGLTDYRTAQRDIQLQEQRQQMFKDLMSAKPGGIVRVPDDVMAQHLSRPFSLPRQRGNCEGCGAPRTQPRECGYCGRIT